jgi:hypothetical protein
MIFENKRDSFILDARPVADPLPGTSAHLCRPRNHHADRLLFEAESFAARGLSPGSPALDQARIAAEADVHNLCEAVGVTFDLTGLAERIRMRAADWQSLSVSWTERQISPNYGKAAPLWDSGGESPCRFCPCR